MGALQLPGADPDALMTSGDFSKPAIDITARAKGVIVLIDGPEMARLMVEFEVGAEHRAMKSPTLHADAFEEYTPSVVPYRGWTYISTKGTGGVHSPRMISMTERIT